MTDAVDQLNRLVVAVKLVEQNDGFVYRDTHWGDRRCTVCLNGAQNGGYASDIQDIDHVEDCPVAALLTLLTSILGEG